MKKANKVSKSMKSGKNSKSAQATAQAVVIALDVKQNHSMRCKMEQCGVDAMVAHSEEKASKGYFAEMAKRAAKGGEVQGVSRVLIINGVSERITLDEKSGDYSRKAGNRVLFGNVQTLRSLYGERVSVLSDEDIAKRYAAQKEQSKRKLGDGREIMGRVLLSGNKGDMTLDVFGVDLGNGKIALHNLEDKSNAHQRKANRWQLIQDKTASAAKATASK